MKNIAYNDDDINTKISFSYFINISALFLSVARLGTKCSFTAANIDDKIWYLAHSSLEITNISWQALWNYFPDNFSPGKLFVMEL